jgi:hypothetical protein
MYATDIEVISSNGRLYDKTISTTTKSSATPYHGHIPEHHCVALSFESTEAEFDEDQMAMTEHDLSQQKPEAELGDKPAPK